MAYDGDIIQVKVFSAWGDDDKVHHRIERQVNDYLHNYPADCVVSVVPQVSEQMFSSGASAMRYTVTVVLRA